MPLTSHLASFLAHADVVAAAELLASECARATWWAALLAAERMSYIPTRTINAIAHEHVHPRILVS